MCPRFQGCAARLRRTAQRGAVVRVEVRDLRLRLVAAGRCSWGQPDPGGAGKGGSSPDKAGTCPVLPDGAGPASVAERSTRGTGAVTSFDFDTGSNLADRGRERCVPPCAVAAGTSGQG